MLPHVLLIPCHGIILHGAIHQRAVHRYAGLYGYASAIGNHTHNILLPSHPLRVHSIEIGGGEVMLFSIRPKSFL